MRKIILPIFIASVLVFQSCDKNSDSVSKDPVVLTSDQVKIISSSNKFGFDLFKKVTADAPENENVFISPLSVSVTLTMLYNGAAGDTKAAMAKTLGYEGMSDLQINQASRDLINTLMKIDPKVVMEIANSIWYKNEFTVEPSFIDVNKEYFSAEVAKKDFSNPATISDINTWVSDKTHAKIPEVIKEISPDMVMFLINAIYFNGTWKYKFDATQTQKDDFYITPQQKISTDFMVQEGAFEYAGNDLFTAVNLPYGDEDFSMLVLLPKTGKTCSDILSQMNDANWDSWNKSLVKLQKVQIQFPKFKFEFEKKLNDILSDLGMGIIFTDFADLTGIHKEGGICVSYVKHKSFVEVKEEGTEAAAVTVIGIVNTSFGGDPQQVIFRADKPFVFVIKEKNTNSLLFMGVVKNPASVE